MSAWLFGVGTQRDDVWNLGAFSGAWSERFSGHWHFSWTAASRTAGGDVMTFDELMGRRTWTPIRNCPGRFLLVGGPHALPTEELIESDTALPTFDVVTARDTVVVGRIEDGGVISYRRDGRSYVHTLNTAEGFARKLQQLEIVLP